MLFVVPARTHAKEQREREFPAQLKHKAHFRGRERGHYAWYTFNTVTAAAALQAGIEGKSNAHEHIRRAVEKATTTRTEMERIERGSHCPTPNPSPHPEQESDTTHVERPRERECTSLHRQQTHARAQRSSAIAMALRKTAALQLGTVEGKSTGQHRFVELPHTRSAAERKRALHGQQPHTGAAIWSALWRGIQIPVLLAYNRVSSRANAQRL